MWHPASQYITRRHAVTGLTALLIGVSDGACGGGHDPTGPSPDPPQAASGQAIFWTDDARLVPIAVAVAGRNAGSVTRSMSAAPACGQSGGVTVTLPPGSFAYDLATANGYAGTGTVDVGASQCVAVRVYVDEPAVTTGQVVFWTRDASFVPIALQLDRQAVGSVTSARASAPSCGESGGLTLTLAAGSHAVAGSNPRGLTWSGPITIAAGGCLILELS